jgi:hypothetical protein
VIALVICTLIVATALLGWYGHKAYIRVQAWGEKLNEQDAIFQNAATPQEMAGFAMGPKRPPFPAIAEVEHSMPVSMASLK